MDAQYSKKCRSINHFQVQICSMAKMNAFIEGTSAGTIKMLLLNPARTRARLSRQVA